MLHIAHKSGDVSTRQNQPLIYQILGINGVLNVSTSDIFCMPFIFGSFMEPIFFSKKILHLNTIQYVFMCSIIHNRNVYNTGVDGSVMWTLVGMLWNHQNCGHSIVCLLLELGQQKQEDPWVLLTIKCSQINESQGQWIIISRKNRAEGMETLPS